MAKLVHKEQSYTGGGDTSDLIKWSEATTSVKKNLLRNKATSATVTGLTFTVNTDGSVTANDTSTASWSFVINRITIPKGSYILSDGDVGSSNIFIQVTNSAETSAIADTINGESVMTFNSDTDIVVRIFWANGITVSNLTFKPMIRLASIADDTYEPYIKDNVELDADKAGKTQITNPNLLDNPWFTVNQRGISSFSTNGYIVDRWSATRANGTITDSGVSFAWNGQGSLGYIWQRLDNFATLIGKTVTFSAIIDNEIYYVTGVFPAKGGTSITKTITIGNDTIDLNVEYGSQLDYPWVLIRDNSGEAHTVRAIKLEVGSISTLALDTAPNYATELLKCQRYFINLAPLTTTNRNTGASGAKFASLNGCAVSIPIPVAMRTKPSINLVNNGTLYFGDGTMFAVTSVSVDDTFNNAVRFWIPVSVLSGVASPAIWMDYTFSLTADL